MINFYNYLVDDSILNFKNSLKFNRNIIKINSILNLLPNNFKIINGFDYNSNDCKIKSFEKISLEINKNDFDKINKDYIKNKYNCELVYDKSNLLTIIL